MRFLPIQQAMVQQDSYCLLGWEIHLLRCRSKLFAYLYQRAHLYSMMTRVTTLNRWIQSGPKPCSGQEFMDSFDASWSIIRRIIDFVPYLSKGTRTKMGNFVSQPTPSRQWTPQSLGGRVLCKFAAGMLGCWNLYPILGHIQLDLATLY